jgi:UrcA family protein
VKNVIKTRSKLAKFIMTVSFLSLGCTAIGVEALAQQAKAAGAPAEQSTTKWSVTYPVGYSDLDVSKLKGARTLYLRIRHAAEVLCESAATWGKKEGGRVCARPSMMLLLESTSHSCHGRVQRCHGSGPLEITD